MRLSIVMLYGLFLLCCCGFGERTARSLGLGRGAMAAALLLAGLLAFVDLQAFPHVSVNPSFLLLLILGISLTGPGTETMLALPAAFASGVLAWLIHMALPGFSESGILIGTAAAGIGLLLPGRRLGLASVLLSPLFYGFLLMLEDWYLFDIILFSFGSPIQLDGQTFGVFLYALGTAFLPQIPYAKILLKINT